MSTANKLTYLNTTKQNLKTVINTTGAGLTNESTFRSYANVLNDKILGAINGDVDLFEEYPKVSGNGTDLSLNGIVEGKMAITPQGVSSQDGEPTPTTPVPVKSVTGENSLMLQNENLFYSEMEQGAWTFANGTSFPSNQYIRTKNKTSVVEGETYTLSFKGVQPTNTDSGFVFYNNGTFVGSIQTKNLTFEVPNGANQVVYDLYRYSGITPNDIYDIILVKGSTAPSTYVEHEEQNYQLSLGNIELNSSPDGTIRDGIIGSSDVSYNLFDITQYPVASKIAYSSRGEQRNWANYVGVNNYFLVKPSTTYNISNSLSETTSMIVYYDKQQNILSTQGNSNTFTTPSDAKYIRFCYYDTSERIPSWVQITEGSEVKPYFPYGQVGMWYKREYIGKVVLDGSESGYSMPSEKRFNLDGYLESYVKQNAIINYYCDNYKGYGQTGSNGDFNSLVANADYGFNLSWANSNTIRFKDTRFANLNDFKAWLSTHNTTVWYQKAQYTDIPITDTTLINQLNDIYNNAHSYNGVTNITTTYEDGNEQMYLDIEALKNVWYTSL